MDMLEDFNAQMEEFVEQKKSEDRIPQAIIDVWNCAVNVDEYGLINYDSRNLIKELELLRSTINTLDKRCEEDEELIASGGKYE